MGTKLSIGQFYGIELNWWPAKIAETAMFLVDHQANRDLAEAIGTAPERLPIKITAHIIHGNALQLDWTNALPEVSGSTFVFGNPPFSGARMMSKQQKAELFSAWDGLKGANQLDYVTGWHAKSLQLLTHRRGAFAFVTTNSIVQGQPVPTLFKPIFDAGWRIRFAHRTFAWDSEAPGKAAVHCVIVGFDRQHEPRAKLWDYPDVKEEAIEIPVERAINAYLVDGANILVTSTSKPISPELAPTSFGSMPNDGGNLIVEVDEYDEIAADPIAAKYLRPFRGSQEMLRGLKRWCLWMEDLDPSDIAKSNLLRKRIEAVQQRRATSTRAATKALAQTPHLFGERRQPLTDYLCLPKVSSVSRNYFTVQRYSADIIASDLVFHAQDPDGLQFSLASSSMFITWQKTIGGRLKSDLRFSGTLVWNNFPVPKLDETTKDRIIKAGEGVLTARKLHPERSLAEHYNPLAMDPSLVKAHDALDREVDKAFGAARKLSNARQRQELLFASYSKMTQGN